MIKENIQILEEEIIKLSNEKITSSSAQIIASLYCSNLALKELLKEEGESIPFYQESATEGEIRSESTIIPSLQTFYNSHNEHFLKKVCLEIDELCVSVYANLKTEEEKNIFMQSMQNLCKRWS